MIEPILLDFFQQGEKIQVEANTHFALDDLTSFFWIEEEGGDLFLFSKGDKSFIPQFVRDAKEKELLFPSPTITENHNFAFFFVPSRKAILRKISFAALSEKIRSSPELKLAIAPLLDRWVIPLLSYFLPRRHEEASDLYFTIGEKVEAKEGQTLALTSTLMPEEKSRVVFLKISKGEADLCAQPQYTYRANAGLFYPFYFSHWLAAKSDLSMETMLVEEILLQSSSALWESIQQLHRQVFHALVQKRERELQEALVRMQKKKQLEEEQYQETFYKLGTVLDDKSAIPSVHEGSPLYKACDLIGQELKVQIHAPATVTGSLHDQVREIAVRNGLYFRKVSLKRGWQRQACAPILGFWNEGGAVALIQKKGEYVAVDPLTLRTTPVKQIEGRLSEKGYSFYEGFPKKTLRLFDFVRSIFKYNLNDFSFVLLLAVLGGVLNLFMPFAMKTLFDTLSFGKDLNLLSQLTMGLFLTACSTSIFNLVKNFTIQKIHGISKSQLETSVWSRVLDLSASFFRRLPVGHLMNFLVSFQRIRMDLVSNMVKFIVDTSYCFFYLILMVVYSWKLAALGLAGMFLAALIYSVSIYIQVKLTGQSIDLTSRIQGVVVQIINGIAKIRVAGAESRFFSLWGTLFTKKKKIDIKIQYTNAVQSLVFRLFPILMTALLFTCALAIFKGETSFLPTPNTLTMGTFLGFATAFNLFVMAALEILETIFAQSVSLPTWKKAKFVLEEPLEKMQEKMPVVRLKGGIALERISFRYDKEGEWILNDVSIVANPGEMVAIVGPSGSGKSTLVRLLLGFETPEHGDVLYDDLALHDLDVRSVRKQIGVVLQNAGILAGSLYENIVGAGSFSAEEIERALMLSGFGEDLGKLPMGLSTVLPMGGSTLSGGQRQRLYLARALVSSPKILILDEATSALDNKTQELVSSNLDAINVTRIVIAHRLSTIKHADRIYVLDRGQILESGTFNELQEKAGLFSQMLKRQQV